MSDKDSHKNRIAINKICSCIQFSGPNCVDFLNNLLISDLPSLSPNKYHYSALCNPKGRIISSLWISISNNDHLMLICPTNMQQELLNFFNMRKFRLKIDLKATQDKIYLNSNSEIFIGDANEDIADADTAKFYKTLFNLNLPWVDKENSEKFIPQHVNLDQHEGIMSFSKGCYPGQEIIARMKFLGKIKKRMVVISAESESALLALFKSKDQVSPIINGLENYSVQVIQRFTE